VLGANGRARAAELSWAAADDELRSGVAAVLDGAAADGSAVDPAVDGAGVGGLSA
jgi:hypothetical protein